jgi:hypothetical protein
LKHLGRNSAEHLCMCGGWRAAKRSTQEAEKEQFRTETWGRGQS